LERCKHLIALANRENAEVETFHVKRNMISLRIFNNELADAQDAIEEGVGIRVAKEGRIGFSATNNLSRESLEKSFKSALKLAKVSKRIPKWSGFPCKEDARSCRRTEALKGEESVSVNTDETVDLGLRMIKQATASDAACTLTGSLTRLSEEFSVMNSNGLEHQFNVSSAVNTRIIIEARKNEDYCTKEGQFCSRNLSDLRPEEEVGNLISGALELLALPKRKIPDGKCGVILSPESAGAFVYYLVSPMILGTSALTGTSCLTGMLKMTVASESFSMLDNGQIEDGIASACIDDEGTPTRSTVIFGNGVFSNFLFDTLTASLYESKTTGNARRVSDTLGRTYINPPEPLPTNLVVAPGDFSPEELVEMTNSGAIIDSIGYTFHLVPERGYFSMMSNVPAQVVENGRIKGRTGNATVSGSLVETLPKIEGIGKELRQSTFLGSAATFSPHLRIRDISLRGTG
jgi:PmbA protein